MPDTSDGTCKITFVTYPLHIDVPVREEEGADVRHGRGGRAELGQRHDVFEGDVGLGAHVHHHDFLRGPPGARGVTPEHLHHDGVLGATERLHCLIVARLGEGLAVNLESGGDKDIRSDPNIRQISNRRQILHLHLHLVI